VIHVRTPDLLLDKHEDHLKYYTMLFIAFLQGYFKENKQGKFRWSPDLNQTEIVICDQDNLLTDAYIPRIITVRGPSVPAPMTFNDMGDQYNAATGAIKRVLLVQSSITFHCISKTGPEAQNIAYQVMKAINAYYLTLQKWGIHKVMRNVQLSPETPAGAVFNPEIFPEGRLVMATTQFWYLLTLRMTPAESPAAKSLDLFIDASMGEGLAQELKNVIADPAGVAFIQPDIKSTVQDPKYTNKET
jgi:hypothetical protein